VDAEHIKPASYEEAAAVIRELGSRGLRGEFTPEFGLILGSGLRDLADAVESPQVIPYPEVPGFPPSTVEGHDGRLILGWLEGRPIVVMQGRAHLYEGYSPQRVTFPVRVMRLLGVRTLIATNAAGGLSRDLHVGDLMCISDHIFLPGMAGLHPLRGPNDPSSGPRFPDMSQAYDPTLRRLALAVARREGLPVHEGVYAMVAGPSFETPAELRFLRLAGADAVGMSTAPEVIVARHCGLRVLAISGISNLARFESAAGEITTHDEVLAAASVVAPRMEKLVRGVLIDAEPTSPELSE
jgi:purine-nucleoside phosphorylase